MPLRLESCRQSRSLRRPPFLQAADHHHRVWRQNFRESNLPAPAITDQNIDVGLDLDPFCKRLKLSFGEFGWDGWLIERKGIRHCAKNNKPQPYAQITSQISGGAQRVPRGPVPREDHVNFMKYALACF